MKLKLFVTESFTTNITRESKEIESDDYPELEGMTEDEIIEYIDSNVWEMKPINGDLYSSLAEELKDCDMEHDEISDDETNIYIETI
jgi:hypothetical protein